MPDTQHNRAARRRHAQREMRGYLERLARVSPWKTDTSGRWSSCVFCKIVFDSESPTAHRGHRGGCLWVDVSDWLDRHRVQEDA